MAGNLETISNNLQRYLRSSIQSEKYKMMFSFFGLAIYIPFTECGQAEESEKCQEYPDHSEEVVLSKES